MISTLLNRLRIVDGEIHPLVSELVCLSSNDIEMDFDGVYTIEAIHRDVFKQREGG